MTLITQALTEAKKKGVIDKFPETVAVVGFFLRADLTTLKDWPSLKSKVDSVRNTFASTSRPLVKNIRRRKIAITFVDAMLLSPQGSSLKTVGKSIGVEKIELPPGQIERMDLLLRDDPELFERYALQDAVIAARYLQQISDVLPTKLGVGKPVPTLGAAGVLLIRKAVENLGISSDNYFGYVRHRRAKHYLSSLTEAWPFASNCYHGGRSEAFYLGYTPLGTKLYDVDLTSAYTTAMAMIKVPDWESAKQEHDIAKLAVVCDAMTIARVGFSFPNETRYPSLPVRARGSRARLSTKRARAGAQAPNSSWRSPKALGSSWRWGGGSNGLKVHPVLLKVSRGPSIRFVRTPRRVAMFCWTNSPKRLEIPVMARSPKPSTRPEP